MLCADRLDRFVQLMLGCVQMFFRLGAMPGHIVVIGSAGVLQLMDRFLHVVMDRVQIVPVMNPVGNRDPRDK